MIENRENEKIKEESEKRSKSVNKEDCHYSNTISQILEEKHQELTNLDKSLLKNIQRSMKKL